VLDGQEDSFAKFMKVMAHALTGKSSAFPGIAATSLCEWWNAGCVWKQRFYAGERRFHALTRASKDGRGDAGNIDFADYS
jgi:hypothetical protein